MCNPKNRKLENAILKGPSTRHRKTLLALKTFKHFKNQGCRNLTDDWTLFSNNFDAETVDYDTLHRKTTSLIYTIVFSTKKDRLSKKPTRTYTALNSTDTLTVYRHNKGNFSQLPVRDTLSTYPSADLKVKAFAMSFHLPEMSDQSYLTQVYSL